MTPAPTPTSICRAAKSLRPRPSPNHFSPMAKARTSCSRRTGAPKRASSAPGSVVPSSPGTAVHDSTVPASGSQSAGTVSPTPRSRPR